MRNTATLFLLMFTCAAISLHAQQFPSPLTRVDETLQLAGKSIRSQNAVIAVQVNDTLGSPLINQFKGLFNIGAVAGNKPLLATFPQERYFSHFNVRIDGNVYSNNPTRTGTLALPLLSNPVPLADGTITCSYRINNVTIEQRLTPEQYNSTTGAILIKYIITNNDASPHQVGLLLLLDTFVGTKDDARVATRFDYSRIEREYLALSVPDYFQAFESDNPILPGLIAQGTLVGREAVRPDLMIVGDFFTMRTVKWDYTIQNPFYNDSAVILRWNETRLAAGESRTIATYYGIGDANFKPGTLALNLTAPNHLEAFAGQLTPNPFEINLIVLNSGGAVANGVQARLNLPAGLVLASGELASKSVSPTDLNPLQFGTASWKVLAQCPPAADSLKFNVEVKSTNGLANTLERKIFVPSCAAFNLTVTPAAQNIVAGQPASYSVRMQPSGGFTGAIRLALSPATPPPGITANFSPSRIDANTTAMLTLQTNAGSLAGNYSFVIVGESGGLTRQEMISLLVQAAPPADKLPPVTSNHNPARGAKNVPLNSEIVVEVADAQSDVDRNALSMNVVGIAGAIDITEIRSLPKTYRLRFRPSVAFRDHQTVQVRLNARDTATPPNLMPEDSYAFITVRDSLPPLALNHFPARGAINVPANTTIAFELRDDLTGVKRNSILLRVNNLLVNPTITDDQQNYRVSYALTSANLSGDSVRVQIDAADLATTPNAMTARYFFVLANAKVKDTKPPFATNHRPAKGATNVPLDTDIRIEVHDELAGVDRASLSMLVNGQAVQPAIAQIPSGYLLQYKPPQSFRYNATVQVVLGARDLSQLANEMTPDTLRFSTIRDVAPPFTTDHQPAKGATEALANTNIVLHIRDLAAGVEARSIALTVNGSPVSPTISGNPQDLKVEYDPPNDFAAGDTVRVSVVAQDVSSPPNVMPRENYFLVIQQRLPDLAVTSLRPVGVLFVGLQGEVIGEIMNTGAIEAALPFKVQFQVDGGTQKDTTFTRLTAGARVNVRMPLRFQTTGTHEVEMIVDAGDQIREVTEANNRQKLVVQISQSAAIANRVTVRPNPFTPNNDGFNDQVEFDFAGMGLRNPSLQIFDANGVAVWSPHGPAAGRFSWNGRDDRGREVTPGVYLYTLRDQGNNVASGYVVVAR